MDNNRTVYIDDNGIKRKAKRSRKIEEVFKYEGRMWVRMSDNALLWYDAEKNKWVKLPDIL
jgi:hypothetical protein